MRSNLILNSTEKAILKETASGLKLKKISEKLGLSVSKIYQYSRTLKLKLGARNMTNAIYIAYKKNLFK